ncbi:MAG TPA: tol-pal system protein YbgF [Rhizomicrobium sp.]|nr:tol-pal system protein YbgF [Rhizomicrobium sp.]
MAKMRNSSTETRAFWTAVIVIIGVSAGAAGALADVQMAATDAPKVARKLNPDEMQARAARWFASDQPQQVQAVRVAGLFGESDDEKAARLAKEQAQDASIAQLNQQVSDLQDSVRRLTGQIEMLSHKLSDANARMDRMQKDFDYKICTMTAQQLGESTDAASGGLPCAAQQNNGAGAPSAQPGTQQSGAVHLAPPPGVLGQIPSNQPLPLAAPGSPDAGGPTPSMTRPQFDAAMNLLSKAQYDEARAAFRNFADTYPKDDLAPQALYWVGDIAYVQKDYANAARAFAEGIKKYGSGPRAPESMLKLGQSLIAMNQKQEGCTTLDALPGKYPKASQAILADAKNSRKAAHCK